MRQGAGFPGFDGPVREVANVPQFRWLRLCAAQRAARITLDRVPTITSGWLGRPYARTSILIFKEHVACRFQRPAQAVTAALAGFDNL